MNCRKCGEPKESSEFHIPAWDKGVYCDSCLDKYDMSICDDCDHAVEEGYHLCPPCHTSRDAHRKT